MSKVLAILGDSPRKFLQIKSLFESRKEYKDFKIIHVTEFEQLAGIMIYEYRLTQAFIKGDSWELFDKVQDRLTEDSPCHVCDKRPFHLP